MRNEYDFFNMLSSIVMRDCYSAGTFLLFFHRYLTLIELTKYKCALFVFLGELLLVAFTMCFDV